MDGSVKVNDELPTEVGFLVRQQADIRLKARKEERYKRLKYYQAHNRHLHEMKCHNEATPFQTIFNQRIGTWIRCGWM